MAKTATKPAITPLSDPKRVVRYLLSEIEAAQKRHRERGMSLIRDRVLKARLEKELKSPSTKKLLTKYKALRKKSRLLAEQLQEMEDIVKHQGFYLRTTEYRWDGRRSVPLKEPVVELAVLQHDKTDAEMRSAYTSQAEKLQTLYDRVLIEGSGADGGWVKEILAELRGL